MSSSKPVTPRNDRRQNSGRRHLHRSSGIQLPSMSPKVHHYPIDAENLPMDSPEIVEKFASLAESMETLDLHMTICVIFMIIYRINSTNRLQVFYMGCQ